MLKINDKDNRPTLGVNYSPYGDQKVYQIPLKSKMGQEKVCELECNNPTVCVCLLTVNRNIYKIIRSTKVLNSSTY